MAKRPTKSYTPKPKQGDAAKNATLNKPLSEVSDEEIIATEGGLPAMPDFGGGDEGEKEKEPTPVGVPKGYSVKKTMVKKRYSPFAGAKTKTVDVPPRYFAGDEMKPATLAPSAIAALQRQMVDAGLLKKTGFRLGVWDDASVAAYKDLLAFANRTGLDRQAALSQYARGFADLESSGEPGGEYAGYGTQPEEEEEEEKRAPFIAKLTNPEDLKNLLEDSSTRVIGRRLKADEAQRFIDTYQEMERTKQRQAYDMEDPDNPQGGDFVDMPNAGGEAESFVRKGFDAEASSYDAIGRFNQFMDLM
ncbi:MAG TPA: hypothetical protein VMZ51_08205 [Acidimicrobiales bacterium]|nr:hypothetical protein [Acidimicrobiales bacterium]